MWKFLCPGTENISPSKLPFCSDTSSLKRIIIMQRVLLLILRQAKGFPPAQRGVCVNYSLKEAAVLRSLLERHLAV